MSERRPGITLALAAAALIAVAAGSALALRALRGRAGAVRRAAVGATAALGRAPGLDGAGADGARRAEPPPASPAELAELQRSWVGSEMIAPRPERVDPASGETVLAFQGFGLQVDTTPPGARILVDGEEMGTSPLLTSVACRPGDAVQVRAELGGRATAAKTRCRKDLLVKLSLPLPPAPAPGGRR